jgi:hypothetical protein
LPSRWRTGDRSIAHADKQPALRAPPDWDPDAVTPKDRSCKIEITLNASAQSQTRPESRSEAAPLKGFCPSRSWAKSHAAILSS